jgi:hypothetical protein
MRSFGDVDDNQTIGYDTKINYSIVASWSGQAWRRRRTTCTPPLSAASSLSVFWCVLSVIGGSFSQLQLVNESFQSLSGMSLVNGKCQ